MNVAPPDSASTFVMAAVSVVLPWSTCPIVPTLQCGLFRSNFAFAIARSPSSLSGPNDPKLFRRLGAHFFGDRLGHRRVVIEMHGVLGPSLRHAAQLVD